MESTDEATLQAIRKGSTEAIDREAIRLLRQHNIISMTALVTDFAQATDRDYWRTLRQIIAYDPDQIQALYATPHRWTPFAGQQANRRVIQTDLSRWDYKHQVLESSHVPNWRVLLWVKLIEAVSQLRPKSVFRLLAHPDRGFRAAMRWYYSIGRRVWPYELWHWLFCDRRTAHGPTVAEFLRDGGSALGGNSMLPAEGGRCEPGRLAVPRSETLSGFGGGATLHPRGIGGISKPWPGIPDLLPSTRMDQRERAAVSEALDQSS